MTNQKKIGVIIISTLFCFGFANNVLAIQTTEETSTTETSLIAAQEDIILQLQKKIAELQKTIALMQAQIDDLIKVKPSVNAIKKVSAEAVPKKVTASLSKLSKPLYVGVVGDEVTLLQEFLAEDSDIYPEGLVTGYYGPLTQKAVKKFQKKYGIEQVGVVGPKTREKMNKLFDNKTDSKEKQTVSSSVKSIILSSGTGGEIMWNTNGISAKGFKVAWSKNSGPTYPTRSGDKYQYLSSSNANSATLSAFDGDGTYYVRVCEYLGGACGVYSSEITIILDDDNSSGEKCAKEGEMTSGAVSPEYQYGCCNGLESFDINPVGWVGGGLLCYDPDKGEPKCDAVGSKSEGWYYSGTGELLKWADCAD